MIAQINSHNDHFFYKNSQAAKDKTGQKWYEKNEICHTLPGYTQGNSIVKRTSRTFVKDNIPSKCA